MSRSARVSRRSRWRRISRRSIGALSASDRIWIWGTLLGVVVVAMRLSSRAQDTRAAGADPWGRLINDREDDHREEGLEDGLRRAQGGLLVADLDVAPDQEEEQLARGEEFPPVDGDPSRARADHDLEDLRLGRRGGSGQS